VIAGAGNFSHESLLEEVAKQGWFDGDRGVGKGKEAPPAAPVPPAARGTVRTFEKETQQTHIVFATDTVPYSDRRKFALLVLSNIFGGGMSSRLFQRIREELGLAYAIYSFTSFYRAMGVAGVYVGTQPARAAEATAAIRAEYARLAREGLAGAALDDAKQQTLGQLMLSLESPTAKMYRLASTSVNGEPYLSLDEMLATVAALTADDMAGAAAEFFAPDRQTVVSLGPKGGA
jgi:predicted Zn-dependent peptidase